MKRNFLLLFLAFLLLKISSNAQNIIPQHDITAVYNINIPGLEVPPLIFSEFRVDLAGNMYLEIANVGTQEIDLSDFTIISMQNYGGLATINDEIFTLRNNYRKLELSGTLAAGESYVFASVFDNLFVDGAIDPNGYPVQNIGILKVADLLMHQPEPTATQFLNKPNYEAYDFDSITMYSMHNVDLYTGYILQYRFDNSGVLDSTVTDLANLYHSVENYQGKEPKAIAGVADAVDNYIMVRKASVKKGNPSWDNSIGTNAEDSEWMTIPVFKSKYNIYTTIGSHGDFQLDYSAKKSTFVINNDTKVLTLPWETVRGENIIDHFNVGPGMAWKYTPKGDLRFSTVQDGDILTFYAAGNSLKKIDLTIKVSQPTANLAIAYSRRKRVEVLRDQGATQILYPEIYLINQGNTPSALGYINGVEFAIRKDS